MNLHELIPVLLTAGATHPQIVENLLGPLTKQAGEAAGKLVQAGRLALAPVDYLAALQQRYQNYLARIAQKVTTENIVSAPPQIVGPILEKLTFEDVDGPLAEMFIDLIVSSMDKTRLHNAHPAFPGILASLSRDEAYLLYVMSKRGVKYYRHQRKDKDDQYQYEDRFDGVLPEKLFFPMNAWIYFSHLSSLGLTPMMVAKAESYDVKEGEKKVGWVGIYNPMLTEFGQMFARACIPRDLSKFGFDYEQMPE